MNTVYSFSGIVSKERALSVKSRVDLLRKIVSFGTCLEHTF